MANGLLERFRGLRRIELFAALTLGAMLALVLLNGKSGGGGGQKTELEARVEGILEQIDGTGRVSVMIHQREDGGVNGVLIVADGLEDVAVYLRVRRAVEALLEIDASQIGIIGRHGAFGGGV